MKLGRNLTIGLANSIWSALITFAVVPIYLKYLGAESYGLIGFFVTAQALIVLLDLGLSSTINRELARSTTTESLKDAAHLLHTLAVIYWAITLIIAIVVIGLSPLIANHWLQSKQLPANTVSHAVMLIGFVIACRWPIALYQGALIGSQRLSMQSSINIVMVTLSHLGAVAVLVYLSPTIEAYFIWQAIVGIIYVITIRTVAWKVVGRPKNLVFSTAKLKQIWRFSIGMSAVSIAGLVFMQLDKLILSRLISLEDFGHYMLATVLVSSLYLLITPVYNVIYPKFSALVASKDDLQLANVYLLGTRLLASILFPLAMLLAVFSYNIVSIWTSNESVARDVAPLVSLLAIGSAIHGIMYFPYALQLAYGKTSIPIKINTILIVLTIPITIYLTLQLGPLGGALAWPLLHVCYFFIGVCATHKDLLKKIKWVWVTECVGIPLIISILLGIFNYYFIAESLKFSIYIKLTLGVMVTLLAILLSVLSSPTLRKLHLNPFSLIPFNHRETSHSRDS